MIVYGTRGAKIPKAPLKQIALPVRSPMARSSIFSDVMPIFSGYRFFLTASLWYRNAENAATN